MRRGELQLPNRGAVKDDRDDRDGVRNPQLGGCTPQLPAKGSHASTTHSPQPQTGSKTQALRAWWVLFKQKYRGVQISQEEMLGENTFTTPTPFPASPQSLPKSRVASPVLAVTVWQYPPPHSSGQKNYIKLFSTGKVCISILLNILIIKSNVWLV